MTTTTETIRRINLNRVSPEVYEAMVDAEQRGREGHRPGSGRADQDSRVADEPLRVLP